MSTFKDLAAVNNDTHQVIVQASARPQLRCLWMHVLGEVQLLKDLNVLLPHRLASPISYGHVAHQHIGGGIEAAAAELDRLSARSTNSG